MDIKVRLKNLLKEAETYQHQGLLNEAKESYKKATELIRSTPDVQGGQVLIESIVKRVVKLNQEINAINEAISKPLVSEGNQDLIKRLFASSMVTDPDQAALEGAITLAKFGQFERALKEFQTVLGNPALQVTAGKNIMRCLAELGDGERAGDTFEAWRKDPRFGPAQLEKIRFFANQRLSKAGLEPIRNAAEDVSERLPAGEDPPARPVSPGGNGDGVKALGVDPDELASEEDVLDISSIGLSLEAGAFEGQKIELDVSFQSGNTLNIIVPKDHQGLIDHLQVGTRLENIQFFSPIAILNGSGIVTACNRILTGPKEGSFSLDIAILK